MALQAATPKLLIDKGIITPQEAVRAIETVQHNFSGVHQDVRISAAASGMRKLGPSKDRPL